MSIIDDIKNMFSSNGEKKPEIFPYPDSIDMEKFFYEHANDAGMKERDHFYESLKLSYFSESYFNKDKKNNWYSYFDNEEQAQMYALNILNKKMLKGVADNYYNRDPEYTLVALKSCLDFIMQKNEIEPWVVWKELAEFKRYQYDGGGNPMPERREMLVNGMRYMGEHNYLADEKKLRADITSYNNSMGWDASLRENETRESRQAGIDAWIEEEIAAIMDIQKPYEKKNNNLMDKIVQIRDEATKTDSKDNKPQL